jgi:hypothetical protein
MTVQPPIYKTFRNRGKYAQPRVEASRGLRCRGCDALCADYPTLEIHERFCEVAISRTALAREVASRLSLSTRKVSLEQ